MSREFCRSLRKLISGNAMMTVDQDCFPADLYHREAVRDALIAFIAAMSQAQAEATKVAQIAGIEHAKAQGDKYKGPKPSYTRDQLRAVQDMLGQDAGISVIAKTTGLSRQAIYRIKDDPAGAEAVLAEWRM